VIGGTRTGFRRAAPPVLYREFAADVATGGVEGKAGLSHCVKLSVRSREFTGRETCAPHRSYCQ
jgi:hypothetical protein